MRATARTHFAGLNEEDFQKRPKLNGLNFIRLTEDNRLWLESEFSEEEIYERLKSCDGDKAPGPGISNMKFLHESWHVIKDDVVEMFKELHETSKFVNSLNSTFLVLIAKKKGANDIRDFRPISLVGCIYKHIAKVLAGRLARVLGEVVGECQHALVEGKQILDVVLTANEVVDELVSRGKEGFICKLNMEKAYDHVSWNFMDYMMSEMGFGLKWRKWMKLA